MSGFGVEFFRQKIDSYVSNSDHARQRLLPAWEQDNRGFLVSFDVESLFTRVPVLEALEVIEELLRNDDSFPQRTSMSVDVLCSLSQFSLPSCYFVFNDRY